MQKVLLASTALVMTTGWAMADVTNGGDSLGATITLEGFAEMGVFGSDDDDDDEAGLQFHTDIDLTFVMVGQTDSGLEFGAEIDIDETDGDDDSVSSPAFGNDTQGGEVVYIKGAFGTLTMGDTDGAFDWALQEAIIGDALNDDHEHAGYNGNAGLDGTYDGQVARYDYSFGDFSVAISGEIDDSGDADPILGLGGKYDANFGGTEIGFGAGVQVLSGLDELGETVIDEDDDFSAVIYGISADTTIAGFQVIANYSAAETDGLEDDVDPQHFGIAVGYEFDAVLVSVNYGQYDDWILGDIGDAEGVGVVANYDLGGGASLQAGYGFNDPDDGEEFSTYSFGVAMNF